MPNNIRLTAAFVAVLGLGACGDARLVAVSECENVVAHASKVMGKFAPSTSDMLKQCKAASDEARGCVMDADKPMKLSQCDF